MIEPQRRAEELLAECDKTSARSASDPKRMAEIIIQHGQLRAMLREHIEYQRGFLSILQRLISLVFELLGTVSASTNGRAHWTSELPPGTAPAFRRALNTLIAYVRDLGI